MYGVAAPQILSLAGDRRDTQVFKPEPSRVRKCLAGLHFCYRQRHRALPCFGPYATVLIAVETARFLP